VKYQLLGIALSLATTNVSLGAPSTEATPDAIEFYTYDENVQGNTIDRPGVKCAILRVDGVDEIGRTDSKDLIVVPYDRLFKSGNFAVMFCPASLEPQCASIRLDTDHFHRFAEYNVRVPSIQIIDRTTITVPTKKSRR